MCTSLKLEAGGNEPTELNKSTAYSLQCFDIVGWASEKASDL